FNNNGIEKLRKINLNKLPFVNENERWGSCVARPGKVVCVGLNFTDHANEVNLPIPDEPVIFLKASNSIVGPYDNIKIPKNGEKTDWEIELAFVINRNCTNLNSEVEAESYIAGYTIFNDVTERSFQFDHGGQWTKGKSCDTFGPTGPYLATKEEIKNVNSLSMTLSVNDNLMQASNTDNMIFNPAFITYYLSQFMTLEAGDIVSTGTPHGIGAGMDPQKFLSPGDTVKLKIDGLGEQKQICI
ncbi:MAG: fumarylacetoacetate hydrolase family protein, partial [bacterium]|nr:fumarylacetoacetate hydrolase family protein [bacterium]